MKLRAMIALNSMALMLYPLFAAANGISLKQVAGDTTATQITQLLPNDRGAGDAFGQSVALAGDIALVGAQEHDGKIGAAYIFSRNKNGPNAWGLVIKLTPSNTINNSQFGKSVALLNDIAFIGAPGDDSTAGNVYVYGRNQGGIDVWGEIEVITPTPSIAGDTFGDAIAAFNDTVLVGAPGSSGSPGAAYLFGHNQGSINNWEQITIITPNTTQPVNFGSDVALTDKTMLIGDPAIDSAYIFDRNQGNESAWVEVAKLTSDSVFFGAPVALAADTALVSSAVNNIVYVFNRNQDGTNNWGQVTTIQASDTGKDDAFGIAIDLVDDVALIGAINNNNDTGAAYLFGKNQDGPNVWGEIDKIIENNAAIEDDFGHSVAFTNDTILISACQKTHNVLKIFNKAVFSQLKI